MAEKQLYRFKATNTPEGVRLCAYLGNEPFIANPKQESAKVRLWRKALPGFHFNGHGVEFFEGLERDRATLLFDGPLPLINHRKWEYLDTTAQIGQTYAYWAQGEAPPASGPAYVKVRHPEVWWPEAKLRERLDQLARTPGARLLSLGETTGGRPLPGIALGNRERQIAFVGLIHAGEAGPELIVPILERLAKEEPELLQQVGVAALPSVNLDERERQVAGFPPYLRVNRNGVDLNRNFPAAWEEVEYGYGLVSSDPDAVTYRGPRPASEVETRAVIRFMEEERPLAVFSFHCLASICSPVFLTTREGEKEAAFAARCEALTTPYLAGYYGEARQSPVRFACSAGSLPHWLFEQSRTPCFDLEWDNDPATRGCINDETTPEMVAQCAQQHFEGTRALLRTLAAASDSL